MIKIMMNEFIKIPKNSLRGKVFVFPTDTVYGIACFCDDEIALKRIYQIKERQFDKPMAVLIADILQVNPFIKPLDEKILRIMKKYWPGALTIILEKKEAELNYLTKGKKTLALRQPQSHVVQAIIKTFGPLATTSINISGCEPLNTLEEIALFFGKEIDYLICDQVVLSKTSSTIIDTTNQPFKIIRQGDVFIK